MINDRLKKQMTKTLIAAKAMGIILLILLFLLKTNYWLLYATMITYYLTIIVIIVLLHKKKVLASCSEYLYGPGSIVSSASAITWARDAFQDGCDGLLDGNRGLIALLGSGLILKLVFYDKIHVLLALIINTAMAFIIIVFIQTFINFVLKKMIR